MTGNSDESGNRLERFQPSRCDTGQPREPHLAHDEQLERIKDPHAKLISKPEDAEAYLPEARTVANLDHSGIVPVHDVGSTEDCPSYVVSKYIEGTDLSAKLKKSRLKYRDAAELVATAAEALHYAHKQDRDDYWTLRRQIRLQRLVRFMQHAVGVLMHNSLHQRMRACDFQLQIRQETAFRDIQLLCADRSLAVCRRSNIRLQFPMPVPNSEQAARDDIPNEMLFDGQCAD